MDSPFCTFGLSYVPGLHQNGGSGESPFPTHYLAHLVTGFSHAQSQWRK